MPIRPELRHYYRGEWLKIIRPRILERAGDKCEQCLAPNRAFVVRHKQYPGWWFGIDNGEAHSPDGKLHGYIRGSEMPPEYRIVRIVLTVAHLNHDPSDNRDENLKALCQWCHLHYDQCHHRETRCERKDRERPLLALAR